MGVEIAPFAESFQFFHYGSQKENTYFTDLDLALGTGLTFDLALGTDGSGW